MSKAKSYEDLLKALGEEFNVEMEDVDLRRKEHNTRISCDACGRPLRDAERHVIFRTKDSVTAKHVCADRAACRAYQEHTKRAAEARELVRRQAVVEAVNL